MLSASCSTHYSISDNHVQFFACLASQTIKICCKIHYESHGKQYRGAETEQRAMARQGKMKEGFFETQGVGTAQN
jgi:hypothetical protein